MMPAESGQQGFDNGAILGDRFRIVRAVGRGGMGVVYEAVDQKLNRRVALKCANRRYDGYLTPEARAAREVSHFNVCKVYDLHTFDTPDGEIDCISMEFVEGETLSQYVRRSGPLIHRDALDIALQICAGLAQAHRQQVIHGDLKCANVILAPASEGRPARAVITDFGLARIVDDPDGPAFTGGTHDYMAPEQLLGKPSTTASDVYALGVLFHVMLTGRIPGRNKPIAMPLPRASRLVEAEESTATLEYVIAEADWRRRIDPLPPPWKQVVSRCLASRPQDRFPSAAGVASTLQPRRRLLKWAVGGAAAVVLVVGARQWRTDVGPVTPVRLLVMPLAVDGPRIGSAAGIGLEVADRLSGARRKFTVLSPREAERNQVDTLDKARKSLGATHVLDTHVSASGAMVAANASLVDLQSGRTIGQLQNSYPADDSSSLAQALVATVAEAFQLPGMSLKETVSDAAYPFYVQGIDLLRQDNAGNADRVMPLFQKAIDLDPHSALPYAGLAEAQLQKFSMHEGSQWLDLAETTVAKARGINADAIPVLLASGFVRQQHGLYEQAIHDFTRATELGPNDAEAWRRLAFCYEHANRPDEAAATYRRAIEAQPNYYRHYLTFGTFFLARGQFQRAEEQYMRVIAVAPGLASGHMNLGLAFMQEGRFPEAETQLLEALHLRTSQPLLINIGALYYAQERYREAAEYYDRSLTVGAPSAVQYRNLGDADRHMGKGKEAAEAYRRAMKLAEQDITLNPRKGTSHAELGLVAAFLADTSRAEFELGQALAMEPENRSVMRDAAIAYEVMGERNKTLAALAKAPTLLLEELNRQPDLKDLRYDASFRELLAQRRALPN